VKYKKKTIFWDWNGTLLDDLEICLAGINILLEERNLPLLEKNRYRQIFTFPVKDYYQEAGFDFSDEPFEIPAEEFILHYKVLLPQALLFQDVKIVLQYFQELGFRQFILSAMEQKSLEESIENRGITPFFDGISGINNNLAHSKLENARELISNYKINPKESILIGDTIHDAEVAGDIGIDVVLVARGHQSEERLQKTGLPVINNLSKLKNLLTIG